jgi:hypothetical protein
VGTAMRAIGLVALTLLMITGGPLVLLVGATVGLPTAVVAGLVLAGVVWSGFRLMGGRKLAPDLRAPAMPAGRRDSAWKIPPPSSGM